MDAYIFCGYAALQAKWIISGTWRKRLHSWQCTFLSFRKCLGRRTGLMLECFAEQYYNYKIPSLKKTVICNEFRLFMNFYSDNRKGTLEYFSWFLSSVLLYISREEDRYLLASICTFHALCSEVCRSLTKFEYVTYCLSNQSIFHKFFFVV